MEVSPPPPPPSSPFLVIHGDLLCLCEINHWVQQPPPIISYKVGLGWDHSGAKVGPTYNNVLDVQVQILRHKGSISRDFKDIVVLLLQMSRTCWFSC